MSRLKEILDIVSATEDSDDVLLELLKPEAMSREEAQEVYESCLGYDPTSYYDMSDIKKCIDSLASNDKLPKTIAEVVSEHRDDIAQSAFDKFDESREEYISNAVIDAIYDAVHKYVFDNDSIEWGRVKSLINSILEFDEDDED